MDKYLYVFVNFASILVPFLASFYPKHPFYKHWKSYFKANLVVAGFFVVWDMYFTHLGVWGFNERYITGIHLGNIPIEEVMFFVCIPYASVFVYFALNYLVKTNVLIQFQRSITLFLGIVLLGIAIPFWSRWYTSVTFFLTAVFLGFHYVKKIDLSKIYFSYAVTLVFFFLVNGVLTGTGLEEPVVWYNNNYNLGIRMGTIPVEDTFYGFLLIAATIRLFEYFNEKSPPTSGQG